MAKYDTLTAAIKAAIKTNGVQAITGASLQTQLVNMVAELGAGYQFGGVVAPADSFDSDAFGDTRVAFLACTAGTYAAYGNFTLAAGQVAMFFYDGTWKKQTISFYGNKEIYGIRHYYNNASPDLTRIGASELHRELPVQSQMRRCVVDSTGAVKYYLSATDSTKKEDGTAAVLDGTDGQVMVEIPAHYRKCSLNTAGGYMDVEISLLPFDGAIPVPRYLVGAYEATLDRANSLLSSVVNAADNYRGGNNNADWDGTYRDLRGLPVTNISLTNFRAYGRNRGTGWGCYDYNAHLAIYWLFAIEYATLNSQKAFNPNLDAAGMHQGGLGSGVTNFSNWSTYNSYNPIIPCGFTNSLGNKTGVVTFTLTPEQAEAYGSEHSESVPSYRGIENPFGHIWKWTDGFLAKGMGDDAGYQEVYISRDRSQYASALNDSYVDVGHDASANGYVKAILASNASLSQDIRKYGDLIGTDDSGSASTYFCDYHYTAHALNTIYGALVGGTAADGAYDGLACVHSGNAPAGAPAGVGSRLCWSE